MALADRLSKSGDKRIVRSITKRVQDTATLVADLVRAYQTGAMSARNAAALLQQLRINAQDNLYGISDDRTICLARNVAVGYVKRGLATCQIARKIEKVMANPRQRGYLAILGNGMYRVRARINGTFTDCGLVDSGGKPLSITAVPYQDATERINENHKKRVARRAARRQERERALVRNFEDAWAAQWFDMYGNKSPVWDSVIRGLQK